MKKLVLTLVIVFMASFANAQCVAEVKNVIMDEVRGSIIVETQYKLNGVIVDTQALPNPTAIGRTRYTEESGTLQEIIDKAKADIDQHCGNLIIRNAIRVNNLNEEKLNIQKSLTQPIIEKMQNAVGWTKTLTTKVIQFKNKEITIEADGTYTISDLP